MVIFVPPQREGTAEITENDIDAQIINISSKQLTSSEINILSKNVLVISFRIYVGYYVQ